MISVKGVVLIILAVLVASFSQILLKKSANSTHTGFLSQYLNKKVISGYFMLFISMLLSVWAYSAMSYKYGAPLESVGFILTTVLSAVILKEKITKKKIIGMATIVIGIFVFTYQASTVA